MYVAGYGPEGARRRRAASATASSSSSPTRTSSSGSWASPARAPARPAATRTRSSRSCARPRSSATTWRTPATRCAGSRRWSRTTSWTCCSKYPESELPPALYEYVKRRTFYDYGEHSRVGAKHGEFVDDETCDRFCVLGTPRITSASCKQLEAIGVAHWNIYLMTEGQEQVLEAYGQEIMPALRGPVAA